MGVPLFVGLLALTSLLFPAAACLLIAANLILGGTLEVIRLAATRGARKHSRAAECGLPQRPFISVHLPIHDEPPELVIRTLAALAALDWDCYEVIVLDNNTPSVRTWGPVARLVATLGPRFLFFHVEGLPGAKAGALNLARMLTDSRADLIAVIDADYRVDSRFLRRAAAELTPDLAFVQFPQAYRTETQPAAGVALEATEYFALCPRHANAADAALLTGTLLVIRTFALDAVGGWSARTVTEDAELGLRLCAAGLSGRLIDAPAWQGMLPVDLPSLMTQRRRWIISNFQTLALLPRSPVGLWPPRRLVAIINQLTTWFGWMVPSMLVLLITAAAGALSLADDRHMQLMELAAASLFILAGLAALRLVAAGAATDAGASAVGYVLLSRLALVWESGLALFGATGQGARIFHRTAKTTGARPTAPDLLLLPGLVALGLLPWALVAAAPAVAAALALVAVVTPARVMVDRNLRRAAQIDDPAAPSRPLFLGDPRCT